MPSCGISKLAKAAVLSTLPGKESVSMEKAKYVTPMLVALLACLGASLYTALHRGNQYYHLLWGSGAAASMTGMSFASRFASVKGLDSQVKTFASENKSLEEGNKRLKAQVDVLEQKTLLLETVGEGLNNGVIDLKAIKEEIEKTSGDLAETSRELSDFKQTLIDILNMMDASGKNLTEVRNVLREMREENNRQQANNERQEELLKKQAQVAASLAGSAEVVEAASPQLQKLADGVDRLSKGQGSSSGISRQLTYD